MAKTKVGCDKCGGTGFISAFEHIDGGRCYKCKGTGLVAQPRTPAQPKHTGWSDEFLALQEAEEQAVSAEILADPRWPAFVKVPFKVYDKYGGSSGIKYDERALIAGFCYEFLGGERTYEIARRRLAERGIQPW